MHRELRKPRIVRSLPVFLSLSPLFFLLSLPFLLPFLSQASTLANTELKSHKFNVSVPWLPILTSYRTAVPWKLWLLLIIPRAISFDLLTHPSWRLWWFQFSFSLLTPLPLALFIYPVCLGQKHGESWNTPRCSNPEESPLPLQCQHGMHSLTLCGSYNYFWKGMFTYLILLVMHIVFQALELWTGISRKGGPTNQIQCDSGFISLLKHLVVFSRRRERGRNLVNVLTVRSSDGFLFLPLFCETYCRSQRKGVHSTVAG